MTCIAAESVTPIKNKLTLRRSYHIKMSLPEGDPLRPPSNSQGLDLSKLSPQELKIYKMYGKLPTTNQILASKFQDKKYFDSGDYAMQKQLGNNNRVPQSGVPLKHPNAEKVKEIYNRNSISGSNAGVLYKGTLSLLNESTPSGSSNKEEENVMEEKR